jgi:hypothetical protein
MKTMTDIDEKKSGAALVLALGFLAILTFIFVAFTALMRTERLADRGFLISARNQHLLNAALVRAMEDIDGSIGAEGYPSAPSLSSQGSLPLDVDFSAEEDFIPGTGSSLFTAYQSERQSAGWESVSSANNQMLGRVGYIVLNTSGLIDANYAGGYTNLAGNIDYQPRRFGTSPSEIQLSHTLLSEFTDPKNPAKSFPGIRLDEDGALDITYLQAGDTNLSPALAMVYNRKNAWRHFETQRDFHQLNLLSSVRNGTANILTGRPENFRTFSYFPPENEERVEMGQTFDEVAVQHAQVIEDALEEVGIYGINKDFVFQQLEDYVDADDLPSDPLLSVEPVPLVNEILLTCDFRFTPVVESFDVDPGDGSPSFTTNVVVSVLVTNEYVLEVEAWFPFINAENSSSYSIIIEDVDSDLPQNIFGDIREEWLSVSTSIGGPWEFNQLENSILVESASPGVDFNEEDLRDAFDLDNSLSIDEIDLSCQLSDGTVVDIASGIEFAVGEANDVLNSNVQALADFLFEDSAAAELATYTNFIYTIGAATIDPRLNWDGLNTNHWAETGDNGYGDSIGSINTELINELAVGPEDEPRDRIYVRNEGLIESAYEFTYFLFDMNRPWHTFQFFPENDTSDGGRDFQTRRIAEILVPALSEPILHGLINPNSENTNVLATVFHNMPLNELVSSDYSNVRKMNTIEASRISELILDKQPYRYRTNVVEGISYEAVAGITEGNTWENESILRNAMGLFNTRDTTFTILLAAQEGKDSDGDNQLSNDEVQATQKAVVYIWRDPVTGKSACVFYGLGDTLQSSLSGGSWSDVLNAFKPAP